MRKYLPIVAAVALIIAVVFVARFNKDYDASGKGFDAKCVDGSEPSTGAGSFVCTIQSGQETRDGKSGSDWWHILLTWPEGITTWAVILTLGAITWQAFLMRKHAEHFEKLAAATKTNSDILEKTLTAIQNQTRELSRQNGNMVAKERARIGITFPRETSKLTISTASRILMVRLAANLVNQGGTLAYDITSGYDAFASTDEGLPLSTEIYVLEVPANLQSGGEEPIGPMNVDARYGKGTPYNFYIYVRGYIEYKTVFDNDKKRTSFLLRREFISDKSNQASSSTWWEPCGKPEDNQST